MRKLIFILVLICITAVSTLNVLFSYQIQFIIDALSKNDSASFQSSILIMALIMLLLLILEYCRQYLNVNYLNRVGLDIHETIINRIFKLSYLDFKEKSTGEYISIVNNDIEKIKTYHYDAIISLYQGIVSFIIATVALFSLDAVTAGVILLVSIFPIVIPYAFRARSRSVKNQLSQQQASYNSYLKDFMSGLLDIKNFNSSTLFVENINKKYENVNDSVQAEVKLTSFINVLIALFFYGCVVAILFIGGRQVFRGEITVGALTSILALSSELEMPINLIADNLSSINSVRDIKNRYDSKESNKQTAPSSSRKIDELSNITVKNMSYAIKDNVLFDKFNYEFLQGKKYLIVGSSGKGKSTLAHLITNNIQPDTGEILYNEIASDSLSYQEIQSHIAYISQHASIFNDTLLNNLHLYQDLPLDQTEQLLADVDLSHRFNDLEELIVEDGNLSGGQKQRIIIIRSLLQNKEFFILDESLSALDRENYHRIESYLLEMEDICLINITHRDSDNMEEYDYILDLDQLK